MHGPGTLVRRSWDRKPFHLMTSNGTTKRAPFLCFVVIVFSSGFHKPSFRSVSDVLSSNSLNLRFHILKSISSASKTNNSMKVFKAR